MARLAVARLPNNWGALEPATATGVLWSASSVPILYCGVLTLTLYCTPLAGLSQKLGAVCPLELREISRSPATSRCDSPIWRAFVRSTEKRISGASITCCTRTSTAPGTRDISAASFRAAK